MTLSELLRNQLKLTGTKNACGVGECGSCTVLVEGKPTLSCSTLAIAVRDKDILTIEGLATGAKLHPLQQAFVDEGAVQCGFCTPGMIMTAKALLDENPNPSRDEVKASMIFTYPVHRIRKNHRCGYVCGRDDGKRRQVNERKVIRCWKACPPMGIR